VDSNDLYEEVLTQAAVQARRYLRTIRERHVGVCSRKRSKAYVRSAALCPPGERIQLAILKMLDDAGSPATVASMGGRFFGGVHWCGALPASVAAHWHGQNAWTKNACLV